MSLVYIRYVDPYGTVVAEERVLPQELFVRHLADATVIAGRLWQHERNESAAPEGSVVHVSPWSPDAVDEDTDAIAAVARGFAAPTPAYEVLWFERNLTSYQLVRRTSEQDTLHAARALLYHAYLVDGRALDVAYAVVDAERRKVFVFLRSPQPGGFHG